MTLLSTQKLDIRIGSRTLLRALDLHIARGQLWCVLGRNGVGKTSLMNVLAGVLFPSEGEVLIDGVALPLMSLSELAKRRGLMPQIVTDAFSLSVLETVLVGRTPYRIGRGWDTPTDIAAAHAALTEVDLLDRCDSDIRELSGGERQRVALATLLVQAPDIFLLDEPTAHQDVAHQLAMLHLLQRLSQSSAVIMNCHDINLAARFATHVLLLGEGQHWSGPVQSILQPVLLQAAFGCNFRVFDDAGVTHIVAY